MQIDILSHGFDTISKLSVGSQLIKLFADNSFHTFTGISAFSSKGGINGLSRHLIPAKKHLTHITIITGIDLKGTTKEALEALLDLNINAFVFYQSQDTIFHPKIYLFEGMDKSELIIGSSNLTSKGLFANVESSVAIKIDNKVEADRKIIEQLKIYFKGIFDETDPNLKKLSKKLINQLVNANIIPTEAEKKAEFGKPEKTLKKKASDAILKLFPPRKSFDIPIEFRGATKSKKKIPPKTEEENTEHPNSRGKLVWTRRKLPSSSVQGGSVGTNPTGGLRLVQDDYMVKGIKIDQTIYFRHALFGKYNWKEIRKNPFVEASTIPFEVTIFNKFIGKFELEVRHKPSGEAGQGNYTTSISWGILGEEIRSLNLTGKRLDLYKPKSKGHPFVISIN